MKQRWVLQQRFPRLHTPPALQSVPRRILIQNPRARPDRPVLSTRPNRNAAPSRSTLDRHRHRRRFRRSARRMFERLCQLLQRCPLWLRGAPVDALRHLPRRRRRLRRALCASRSLEQLPRPRLRAVFLLARLRAIAVVVTGCPRVPYAPLRLRLCGVRIRRRRVRRCRIDAGRAAEEGIATWQKGGENLRESKMNTRRRRRELSTRSLASSRVQLVTAKHDRRRTNTQRTVVGRHDGRAATKREARAPESPVSHSLAQQRTKSEQRKPQSLCCSFSQKVSCLMPQTN